jgi:hypothetical protein
MRLAKQILFIAAAGGLVLALTPQVAAADTPATTAQLRTTGAADGVPVTQVRYPYRAYYRPYVAPYGGYYSYGPYGGYGYNTYYRPYVRPYAYPYYAARPYYGNGYYNYGPRWSGYYGYGPRYGYRYGYRW